MAPRGPRGGAPRAGRETRNSALNAKSSSRGGIQKKRGGPIRTDGDGDLVMDPTAARGSKTAPSGPRDSKSRPSTRSTSTPHTRGASKTAQGVAKNLARNGTVNLNSGARSSRSRAQTADLTYLRVHGLKASKAASNPDGGLQDLVSFMERKSSSFAAGAGKRSVMIKKVRLVRAGALEHQRP